MSDADNLKWSYEMGADEAISEEAQDRSVKQEKPQEEPKKTSVISPAQNNVMASPRAVASGTRQVADGCASLKELEEAVRGFKELSICKTATNTVFADGTSEAEIMFIGEAPGAEEDAQGIPFCGASGQMLDQMLSFIDLERKKNFYITNTLFWRPPGNRRPTPEELDICRPFVEKHVALINPKLIVLVGGTAVASILQSKDGITKIRGKYYDYNNGYLESAIKTTAIFHPSYLLRSPGQKRVAWKDALLLKHYLIENNIKF